MTHTPTKLSCVSTSCASVKHVCRAAVDVVGIKVVFAGGRQQIWQWQCVCDSARPFHLSWPGASHL